MLQLTSFERIAFVVVIPRFRLCKLALSICEILIWGSATPLRPCKSQITRFFMLRRLNIVTCKDWHASLLCITTSANKQQELVTLRRKKIQKIESPLFTDKNDAHNHTLLK